MANLTAQARTGRSKGGRKQLRKEGKIPASVYSKEMGTAVVTVDEKEVTAVLRANRHGVIEMDIPGSGKQSVMIQEVQRDPIMGQLVHIDFRQISMDKPVRTMVAIEFSGEPHGVREGGILQVQMHEVEIKCLPANIPPSIVVDVSKLGIGENLTVADLKLTDGIELKSDPADVLATVLMTQKETEESPVDESKVEAAAEAQTPAPRG